MHIIITYTNVSSTKRLLSIQQYLGSPLSEGPDTIVRRVPDANDGAPAQAAVSPPFGWVYLLQDSAPNWFKRTTCQSPIVLCSTYNLRSCFTCNTSGLLA
jgi:hypothetical protein